VGAKESQIQLWLYSHETMGRGTLCHQKSTSSPVLISLSMGQIWLNTHPTIIRIRKKKVKRKLNKFFMQNLMLLTSALVINPGVLLLSVNRNALLSTSSKINLEFRASRRSSSLIFSIPAAKAPLFSINLDAYVLCKRDILKKRSLPSFKNILQDLCNKYIQLANVSFGISPLGGMLFFAEVDFTFKLINK
jgi:hypothetical protein